MKSARNSVSARWNASERARVIEKLVQENYADEDTDAADLAFEAVLENPERTDDEIARVVAQRILQP